MLGLDGQTHGREMGSEGFDETGLIWHALQIGN